MKLSITKQYLGFMHGIGLNIECVIEKAGIINSLWKEELSVSEAEYARFVQELDREITDEQIIALSDMRNVNMFRPTLFAALCSANGYDALHRFAHYEGIVVPMTVQIDETPDMVQIRYRLRELEEALPRVAVVNEQLLLLSLLRTGSGERIIPATVTAPFSYGAAIEAEIGVKTTASEDNCIVFKTADLQKPFLTENNLMWNYLEPELKQKLKESLTEAENFTNVVQGRLMTAIPAGKFDARHIAVSLGTSTRTLQRKLSEEHTTFGEQVRTVQELLVKNYLAKGNLTASEIAYLVGYQNAGSLSRAFKKWTGMTMTEYVRFTTRSAFHENR